MEQRLFGIAIKIATPISLASLAVIAIYLIYKAILGLHIFGDLTGDQTSQLIGNVANNVFYLALVLSVLSIPAYAYTKWLTVSGQRSPLQMNGKRVFRRRPPSNGRYRIRRRQR